MNSCPKCNNEMKEGRATFWESLNFTRVDLRWERKIGEKVVGGIFGEKKKDIYEMGTVVCYKCESCDYLEFRVVNINESE